MPKLQISQQFQKNPRKIRNLCSPDLPSAGGPAQRVGPHARRVRLRRCGGIRMRSGIRAGRTCSTPVPGQPGVERGQAPMQAAKWESSGKSEKIHKKLIRTLNS